MASPNWMPDGEASLPAQTSASSPTIGESSKGSFAAAGITAPGIAAPTASGVDQSKAANESVSEHAPGNFATPGTGLIRPSMLPVMHSGSSNFPSSLQPPVPGHSTSNSLFSYNISHAGVSNNLQGLPQAGTNSVTAASSFASSASQSAYMPPVTSLQVSPGIPRANTSHAAPGIAHVTPLTPNMSTSYTPADSSTLTRPVMASPYPLSSPSVHQQGYMAYPSVPPGAAQGPWMQPPSVGGVVRAPFSSYPAAYNPYPMVGNGLPLASPVWTSPQPHGLIPLRAAGNNPIFPTGSADHETGQQPLLPPGIDNIKHANGDDNRNSSLVSDQAWTAHRTELGSVYYYNAVSGESTYEKPAAFKGEPDNVAAQPTPVSWQKLAGTDWVWVTTNDGKRYYYNTKTKLSSWQIPKEVTDSQVKQEVETLKEQLIPTKEQLNPVTALSMPTEKTSIPVLLNTPAINTGGRDAASYKPFPVVGSSTALDLIKKKLQDYGSPSTSPSSPSTVAVASEANGSGVVESTFKGSENESSKDKVKDSNPDGGLSDTSDSEDEDSGPSKEECINQFKVMLKERGVAPFSKWEKELPKIIFDPRFKAIPSHSARRALFERYVRTRAEEERKEKRAAQRAAVEGFKQLLEEAKEDLDHNTNYQAFKTKWGHDQRFEALEKKERESLLNERVLPLRRAAEEKVRLARAAVISTFKSMLQERGDITSKSRWSKVKDSLRDDPRYKSVKHEEREAFFNEYISELKEGEEKIQQMDKSKLDGEEKLKERERVLRKRKEREEQEVERVRLKTQRKEAIESYQALLVETIKDPQASWTESKSKLERDPQGRAVNPHLDHSDLEKLFREHVKILHERCIQEFRALLAEVITADAALQETEDGKTVLTSWSTAKKLLKVDNRYTKAPRKERESLWLRHVEDTQRRQKLASNENTEKQSDGRRRSADSNRYLTGSRRTDNRR